MVGTPFTSGAASLIGPFLPSPSVINSIASAGEADIDSEMGNPVLVIHNRSQHFVSISARCCCAKQNLESTISVDLGPLKEAIMTLRILGLCVLLAIASPGASLAAGYNCKHFSQANRCNASWDSRAKSCTCH